MKQIPFRKILFWIHFTAGVVAGFVILAMSLTGVLLAFEPQIIDYSERTLRSVPSPGAEDRRLNIETILARAREADPDVPPRRVTLRPDPAASALVAFGREETVFINPYTGAVLGKGSKTHKVLDQVEDWHRWLGSREIGKPLTGVCNAAFLTLVVTGCYLRWPSRWPGATFKAVRWFNPALQGKARDWNRHNVIGFWCAPVLLTLTLTGLIMSFQWANDLLYTLTG